MRRLSMGHLLLEEALPESMRGQNWVLDKQGLQRLLRELAEKHPEKYSDVSKRLADIGRTVATRSGGYSFGLTHLRKAKSAQRLRASLQQEIKQVLDDDRLTDTQRRDLIVRKVGAAMEPQMRAVLEESLQEGNPLAHQVISGSRGSKMTLASLRGSDLLYSDQRDRIIPLPVLRSYSEGLTPVEYWAGTYGARRGVIGTKFATADAGFLGKQLNQVAHRLVVIDVDDQREPIGLRGLPVDTEDLDNEGALLAVDAGPYRRNTALTPKLLKDLTRRGFKRILVRSPIIGGSPEGGVYARDVGVRERGVLPGRGEQVGLAAAQSLSEPLSQGQLSTKHSGGVAGQEKVMSGFQYINQLVQIPKTFKGGAAHAEVDGRVQSVEPAPAGGQYVTIEGKRHYVGPDFELTVERGDDVEAGDTISEGIPNPALVVQFKGIGEGRRYFATAFRRAMADSGIRAHRRNIELLARGLINHVRLTDEFGDHSPDDVVPYSTLEYTWQPRADHQRLPPKRALGKYIEEPVLHYTVGTKIRPSTLRELEEFGVNELAVHDEPPPFEPEMVRGMSALQHDPDWMTRMYGSGLKTSLLDAAQRGAVSDELGTSFVPGLARAADFGRQGLVHPPEPGFVPEDEDMPAKKPTDRPFARHALDIQPIKPALRFSGSGHSGSFMKLSTHVEQVREAQALLRKVAATMPHDQTGHDPAKGPTVNRAAAPGQAASPRPPGASPAPSAPAAPIAKAFNPWQALSSSPGVPAASPRSLASSSYEANPYGGPVGGGLYRPDADQNAMAQFVHGDNYGGPLGNAARFGALFDPGAVATLTSGLNAYSNTNTPGGWGGYPAMGGFEPGLLQQGQVADGAQAAPAGGAAQAQAAPSVGKTLFNAGTSVAAHEGLRRGGNAAIGKGIQALGGRAATGANPAGWLLGALLDITDRTIGTPEVLGGEGMGKPLTRQSHAEGLAGIVDAYNRAGPGGRMIYGPLMALTALTRPISTGEVVFRGPEKKIEGSEYILTGAERDYLNSPAALEDMQKAIAYAENQLKVHRNYLLDPETIPAPANNAEEYRTRQVQQIRDKDIPFFEARIKKMREEHQRVAAEQEAEAAKWQNRPIVHPFTGDFWRGNWKFPWNVE